MATVPSHDSPAPTNLSSLVRTHADAGLSQPLGLDDLPALQAAYAQLERLYAVLLEQAIVFQQHLERPDPSRCVYGCCTPAEHAAADAHETAKEFRWQFGPERAAWLAERGQS